MKPTSKPWTDARLVDKEGNPLRGATAIAYVTECINAGGDRDYYAVLATGADGKPVDVCHTGNGPTSLRNALYIANAPKLLARCEAFIRRSLADADDDIGDYYEEGMELLEDLTVMGED